MTPLQHGLQLVKALRVSIFPIKPNEKVPLLPASWKELSTNDVATIETWVRRFPDANYGVDCGKSGVIVVDIDTKGDKNGMAEWSNFIHGHEATETRRVTTPSGGVHLYFKGLTNSKNGWKKGIDIKSVGGYVVGPGSVIEGNVYKDNANAMVIPAWAWLQDVLGQPVEAEQVLLPEAPLFTKPADMRRAEEYLKGAPVAVEGESGDALTFRVACQLKDLGVAESDAVKLLAEKWNPHCDPPWSMEDLTTKVANAFKYGKVAPAAASVSVFDEPEKEEDKIIRAGRYVHTPPPPRNWIVDKWLPRGYSTLFCGMGGVGKSEALLQLCIAVSTGMPWLGMQTTPAAALYVSCEDDDAELHRRIHHMAKAPEYAMVDLQKYPFFIFNRVGYETLLMKVDKKGDMIDGGFLPILEKQIATAMPPGPKLIVIDTVPDTFGGNENDRAQVNRYVKKTLGALSQRHDCTFVLNAHPAKAEGSEYSGSTAWNNSVRARIEMKFHEEEGYRVLTVHKLNYGTKGTMVVVKRGDDGVYRQSSTDDALAEPCRIMYDEIVRTQDGVNWLSLSNVQCHSLAKHKVVDRKGNELSDNLKLQAVRRLMDKGLVREEEVKGKKVLALRANEMGDIFG